MLSIPRLGQWLQTVWHDNEIGLSLPSTRSQIALCLCHCARAGHLCQLVQQNQFPGGIFGILEAIGPLTVSDTTPLHSTVYNGTGFLGWFECPKDPTHASHAVFTCSGQLG